MYVNIPIIKKINYKLMNYIDYCLSKQNCIDRHIEGKENSFCFVLSLKITGAFSTACKYMPKI